MEFKDYLISKGLTEEQAESIVGGMTDNKFFLSTEERIDERYVALKTKLEETEGDLVSANELVTTLQQENKDNEGLQTKVTEYETELATIKQERVREAGVQSAKALLESLGAVDVDYALFKLGELDISEDGIVKDLDNKVKALTESNPTYFNIEEKDNDLKGYKIVDNKLPGQSDPKKFDLATMTAEEINENWESIQEQENNK